MQAFITTSHCIAKLPLKAAFEAADKYRRLISIHLRGPNGNTKRASKLHSNEREERQVKQWQQKSSLICENQGIMEKLKNVFVVAVVVVFEN